MEVEKIIRVVVPEARAHERLDKFLSEELPNLSRTRIQKLIEENQVLVEGEPAKASRPVAPGEQIEIRLPKPKKLEILPEPIPLDIVHEDDHLIVINKPAGMVVHPAFANYSGTLVNALLYHCRGLSGIGGVERPGIVHRLDKDTSGLIVAAKDDLTHRVLSQQFAEKSCEREYWAVVWGHLRQKEGRIETQIARSPKDRTRMTTHAPGKLAVTNYQVLEEFHLLSLVACHLETGRTHQIRVHLAHLGHPVFGDPTYGGRGRRVTGLSKSDRDRAVQWLRMMPRQALHARTLGFVHPISGKWLRFESELPADMAALLEELRSTLSVLNQREGAD
jgi:23S rRNA pseudouridine1911/1915/1917 synthase